MSPCPIASVPSGCPKLQIPGSTNTRRFDMTRTAVAIRHAAFEDLGPFERAFVEFGLVFRYFDVGVDDLSRLDPGADEIAMILSNCLDPMKRVTNAQHGATG
jgi:hypothetical protein